MDRWWCHLLKERIKGAEQVLGEKILSSLYLLSCHKACGILVSQLGVQPMSPVLEAWSLDRWTAKGVLSSLLEFFHLICLCACLVTQSCLTLYDPLDCSSPGFCVHGILQARILEWVTIPFSRESSQSRDQTQVSHIAGRLPAEPQGKLITY